MGQLSPHFHFCRITLILQAKTEKMSSTSQGKGADAKVSDVTDLTDEQKQDLKVLRDEQKQDL